jgi:uncharacterized protein YciI
MLFAIWIEDAPDSLQRRLKVREAHLERLRGFVAPGKVKMAGPFPKVPGEDPTKTGFAGGLIVADFDTAEAAEQWLKEDPYYAEGVFQNYWIQPYIKVLPAE